MSDLMVSVVCGRCGVTFKVSPEAFEKMEENEQPFLCNACYDLLIEEQETPKRCFEYFICENCKESVDLCVLGENGWELVSVDNGIGYFKREYFK